ncbi:MAG: class I SAM-dependent methyltransferase [Planctomycetota bacterium]
MDNPWLHIPLTDYEGHMTLPQVAQAQLLSDLFADVLDRYAPASVAVLGCSGGNGFERIQPAVTRRVVGVDLNPEYVEHARRRHAGRFDTLELFVGDVQMERFAFAPVELVFAALLLEYVDTVAVLARVRDMLLPGGTLVTVVQLPCATMPEVTPSPYARLGTLASVMQLVPPDELSHRAAAAGYTETAARTAATAAGKQFRVQCFRLGGPGT